MQVTLEQQKIGPMGPNHTEGLRLDPFVRSLIEEHTPSISLSGTLRPGYEFLPFNPENGDLCVFRTLPGTDDPGQVCRVTVVIGFDGLVIHIPVVVIAGSVPEYAG